MVRYQFILYLEPHRKSPFYKTIEKFLMASLAHYGLHEGTMFPPHCDMTKFINKGDYLPATRIADLLDRLVESHGPFARPQVGSMVPVNNAAVRESLLNIPLNLDVRGVGGLISQPYQFMLKEFRYDAFKHCGLTVIPQKMLNIPLVFNYDAWITKNKKLSRKELQMLWDLAQETIDFENAQKCAWHCTLYQVRRSMYFDRHHFFVERPVKSWEVAREVVPQRRWEMDWPD